MIPTIRTTRTTSTAHKTLVHITVNVPNVQVVYAFRHGPHPFSTCENCGCTVMPEWFAHHVGYHFRNETWQLHWEAPHEYPVERW